MTPQLGLFSSDDAGVARVALAPVSAHVQQLATKLPRRVRVGTQSWIYPGWVGPLYAADTREPQLTHGALAAYAQHPLFRTVEIDRSYYEPLSREIYGQYARQVPDDFRFVAKAHGECTAVRAGNPRLLDPAYATDFVVGPYIETLGAKAGPMVFQFSPFHLRSPEKFAEKLHDFLSRLPKGPTYAVEVRNAEVLAGQYGPALASAGAVHCFNIWGGMPDVLSRAHALPNAVRRPLVLRWITRPLDTHEAARVRYEPFSQLVEEDVARRQDVTELTAQSEGDAYLLVSNKVEGSAPESVIRLADMLVARALPS